MVPTRHPRQPSWMSAAASCTRSYRRTRLALLKPPLQAAVGAAVLWMLQHPPANQREVTVVEASASVLMVDLDVDGSQVVVVVVVEIVALAGIVSVVTVRTATDVTRARETL